MTDRLPFDATTLFQALQYQLMVAVERCLDLEEDQALYIEIYGDVTVSSKTQIEVKFYSDSLTDNHGNFWNTIKNWLDLRFDVGQYQKLLLVTTQKFGARSKISVWNSSTAAERLSIMEEIYSIAESKQTKKTNKASTNTQKPRKSSVPESLELQRHVMCLELRTKLIEILNKVTIETEQPDLTTRIATFKRQFLREIIIEKRQSFLDELLGFLSSTRFTQSRWEITCKAFDKQWRTLKQRYMQGTLTFPKIDRSLYNEKAKNEDSESRLFVKKIREIGADEQISEAISERMIAADLLDNFIEAYSISLDQILNYKETQRDLHISHWKAASIDLIGDLCETSHRKKSQKFFHLRRGEAPQQFCSFEMTPAVFRNGLQHMLADEPQTEPTKEFLWRLWK
ncbi:hypothetical protein [Pseudomonas marginalis]|uniref:Uncharacterized protein n=1 Tax=Pseudomonas marginalis TaxID=298 RepID=A0A9X9BSM2_PSEMA|nr:hypothetical protein [Pseudomonas marginalis]TWR58162.1 hypothetical protein FIV41_18245 [Pseudomonas marginalis]SEC93512.1 hypothetical protein SAMN04490193_4067 [Pseudomonas marginalis]